MAFQPTGRASMANTLLSIIKMYQICLLMWNHLKAKSQTAPCFIIPVLIADVIVVVIVEAHK
jgi:hypothetical protein